MLQDADKIVVRKAVKGEDALLIGDGVDYSVEPEDVDFEPMLARDLSDKDEDFILKGVVADKTFIATDVVFHGDYMANKPWKDRFLDLKKNFDFKPSVRWSGSIVVENGDDMKEAVRAFSFSPHFDGVYLERYNSDMFEERAYLDETVTKVIE